jgi:outer membrane immunogenic protein
MSHAGRAGGLGVEGMGGTMSKHRLVTAVVAGLLAGVSQLANAADVNMPYKAPEPVFTWTGCYIGLHAGAGSLQDNYAGAVSQALIDPNTFNTVAQNQWGVGAVGGGQIGCNYQNGRFLIGVEGDFWGSSLKTESNRFQDDDNSRAKTTNPWNASVAVRAGLTIDRFLLFTKGGVAWGRFKYDLALNNLGFPCFCSIVQSGAATSLGFLWGTGVEYMFTQNWTAKFETDFLLYSAPNVNLACTAAFCAQQATISAYEILFKVGINYKFGG